MKVQNNELNDKLNHFDEHFNDIKKEIKKQSCNSDKRLNEIHTWLDEIELENKRGVDLSLIHIWGICMNASVNKNNKMIK